MQELLHGDFSSRLFRGRLNMDNKYSEERRRVAKVLKDISEVKAELVMYHIREKKGKG